MTRMASHATAVAFALAFFCTVASATAPASDGDAPDGWWDAPQRREVLDQTRTLRLDPDLSTLTAGERAAVDHLLAAGAVVQRLYERQVHPQAEQAAAMIDALPAGTARDEFRDLFRLFKGPIATTLDNTREPFLPVGPVQPAKGFYAEELTREDVDTWLAAHASRRDEMLAPRTVVRRGTAAQLDADLATLAAHPVLDLLQEWT